MNGRILHRLAATATALTLGALAAAQPCAWRNITTIPPLPGGGSAAYDSARGATVLHRGENGETSEWDGEIWKRVAIQSTGTQRTSRRGYIFID